jgi:hypothetical protein
MAAEILKKWELYVQNGQALLSVRDSSTPQVCNLSTFVLSEKQNASN